MANKKNRKQQKTKKKAQKQTKDQPKVRLSFLGGLGEVGKNMMTLEHDNQMIVVDAGLMFPTEETPGIDLILPNFSHILKNKKRLKAVILTHGHEDHIGSLPYLLKEIRVPVYGSKLTLGLLKPKLEEQNVKAEMREVTENSQIKIGDFKFEFIPQIHSVPDGMALAIHTPCGIIFHSGDFKFDQTPLANQRVRYDRLTDYAKKGVLLMLSDSTNAETPGFTKPEKIVAEKLHDFFLKSKGRVIVASFASHIHRIQQIIDAAKDTGRVVAVSGRSMRQSIEVATKTGHLKIPKKTFIDIHKIKNYHKDEICVLCTGSQGEPLSALSLIASREHKHIKVKKGDTVIIAASPVPGNERSVGMIINALFKNGANVIYEKIDEVHVSGHASQEELKLMLNMIKPKYFVPIHGEYRHLKYHEKLAISTGIKPNQVFLLENGDSLSISKSGVRKTKKIDAGVVFVDGLGIGDIKDFVLRDRQHLSQDGIVIVVIAINSNQRKIVGGPDIISKGVTYNQKELHATAQEKVYKKVKKIAREEEIIDSKFIKNRIKGTLSNFIYQKTKRKPMVIPIVVEV